MGISNTIFDYENGPLVERFASESGLPIPDAHHVFTQTKKWLWLSAAFIKDKEQKEEHLPNTLFMTKDMEIVDEFWHLFLTFSEDYAHFCEKYLGNFIHHRPSVKPEKDDQQTHDESNELALLEEQLTKLYHYVEKKLGQETLLAWFDELPRKYSRRKKIKNWKVKGTLPWISFFKSATQ